MKNTMKLVAVLVVATPLLAGCHYTRGTDDWTYFGKSKVADHWGEAFHANNDAMTANPEAEKQLTVVEGTDGRSAGQAMGNFRKAGQTSGRKSAPTSVININR